MSDRIHNTGLAPLRRWREGRPVSARLANEVIEVVDAQRRGVQPGRQVVPRLAGVPAAAFAVKLTYCHAIYGGTWGEFVSCVDDSAQLSNTPPLHQFDVALPYLLRSHPWNTHGRPWIGTPAFAYTYESVTTRTAEVIGSDVIERQTITPSYRKGDPLLIAQVPAGALWLGEETYGVEWLDLNLDGRAWAAVSAS